MSAVLNVVIGVVFIFLIFGIAVSAIHEGIATLFAVRSKVLWDALKSFTEKEPDGARKNAIDLGTFLGYYRRGKRTKATERQPDAPTPELHAFLRKVQDKTQRFAPGTTQVNIKKVPSQIVSQALIELGTERIEAKPPATPATQPAPAATAAASASDTTHPCVDGCELMTAVQEAVAGTVGNGG